MSDAISSTPKTQRAVEIDGAKGDIAPLRAFEATLVKVQTATPAAVQQVPSASSSPGRIVTPPASAVSARADSAYSSSSPSADSGQRSPRPAASSGANATVAAVQAGLESQASGNSSKGGASNGVVAKPLFASSDLAKPEGVTPDAAAITSGPNYSGGRVDAGGGDPVAALSSTAALSGALNGGSAADVQAALQSTLEGFASGKVPDAIKAAIGQSADGAGGTLNAHANEIAGLLDNITALAQDILAKGPLSDLDIASNFDQLFWVSSWFDLFNGLTPYDPVSAINNSVNAAMAMPMDILYTRALLVPLVDVERVVSPGLASRRAVRANTETVPGAEQFGPEQLANNV
jgi:hypothetical protein